MWVAMEHPGVEEHREVGVDGHAAQPRHVGRGVEVEARAVDPLSDKDAAAGEVVDDGRRGDGVEAAAGHRLHESLRVRCFEEVVRLGDETAAPLVDERLRQVDVLGVGRYLVDRVGDAASDGESGRWGEVGGEVGWGGVGWDRR